MKHMSLLAAGALAVMCACNCKPNNDFTLNGTTDLPDGEQVVLTYWVSGDSTHADTVAVNAGAFTITGCVDRPYQAALAVGPMSQANGKVRVFMLEPGTTTVDLSGDNYRGADVKGSELTAQMDSLNTVQTSIYDQLMPLRQQFAAVQGDSVKEAEITAQYEALNKQLEQTVIDFVKGHPSSMYNVILMGRVRSMVDLDELKAIYNGLSPEVQAADEQTATFIAALENIAPGAQAPEVAGKDQNGNEVSLSGLKGKVVLLDFWATWCGPCRASLPHVKELYEKYNAKGLEVLAVSLDRDEQAWKDYIADSGMGMENYVNIYDAPYNNDDKYAIQYIPSKFIIDREGKMVGRFDNEEELDAKLADLIGE